MFKITKSILLLFCSVLSLNTGYSQVFFDLSSSYDINSIEGGATWSKTNSDFVYDNSGTSSTQRALLHSSDSYQSVDGFRLTIEYTTGSIGDTDEHDFSFGLVSDETNLTNYDGFNPFRVDNSVYSLGINLTANGDANARGLNFTNGSSRQTLDESGSRVQFETGKSTKVYLEIGTGGSWNYRINDEYEASGVLLNFDASKNYHVVVYGQDDNGGGKSIQSIKLEKAPGAGERAKDLRSTWYSGVHPTLIDDRLKSLKTLTGFGVAMTDGASLSAQHFAPNRLIESLPGGDAVVPTWGDLSSDEPENDVIMDYISDIRGAGFKVKMYTNSENFVGSNQDQFLEFVESWFHYCDTDPEVQAFINSQPYHTGIWNGSEYVDASESHPLRKYMFCYAEYVLKEHSLRYGKYVSSWIFDSGREMSTQGDNATSGVLEEQRIYQAFADAARAGNPDIPVSFQNGRSTNRYDSYPFAHAVRFEDFTFGHAFGGNNNHAEKVNGNQFNLNYQHITRMTETNGNVHDGGNWDWDDQIVGNFHSKISTTAWKFGPQQAWEQDDFNSWSLEAMHAGGSMTWDGSYNRGINSVYDWVYVLFEGLDEHLCKHRFPNDPNWARSFTILPDAVIGENYSHTLIEGEDFWDPEEDDIVSLTHNGPDWLIIREDSDNRWVLEGIPTGVATTLSFTLTATDNMGNSGSRKVEIIVHEGNIVINPNCNNSAELIQAECFNFMSGIENEGENIGSIRNGDWAVYNDIDLTDMNSVQVRASSQTSGGVLELRSGSVTGALIAMIDIEGTGNWNNWELSETNINRTEGVQDLYLVFTGGNSFLYNIDWLSFSENVVCEGTTDIIEAECFDEMSGVETENCSEGTLNVGFIQTGDWLKYNSIDMDNLNTFNARVASRTTGGFIELRLDGVDGTLLTTLDVPATGDWQSWRTDSDTFDEVEGVHDLYLVFNGGMNLNWFSLKQETITSTQSNLETSIEIYPNPAEDYMNITGAEGGGYELFDNSGVIYDQGEIHSGNQVINIGDLTPGVYFMKIVHPKGTKIKKIILNK